MKERFKTIIIVAVLSTLITSFILNPKDILEASVRGLNIWWTIVFPSLLPFFILSELLISYGIVSFLGVLLEPFMRILFRVPGVGGFVLAMGMSSGLPSGAKLSAQLRLDNQLSRLEAERLVTFTNTSNPLFIIGAISAGFFQNEKLGLLLAISHYLSNIIVGFLMRFHGNDLYKKNTYHLSLSTAFKQLHLKRISENRTIGKILGDAIKNSIDILLIIGGFIIFFSVLNKILEVTGVFHFLTSQITHIIPKMIPEKFIYPFFSGIFEITLGSQLISQVENVSLLGQVMVTSCILAFGGMSVHAQVANFLATTDIRYTPYLLARLLQSIIAPICAFLLWKPLYLQLTGNIPVLKSEQSTILMPLTNIGPIITILSLYVYVFLLFYNHYLRKV